MNIEKQIAILKSMLSQNDAQNPGRLPPYWKEIVKRKNESRDSLKETIRRLRIQNRKLLNQVADLKIQVKEIKSKKPRVQSQKHMST